MMNKALRTLLSGLMIAALGLLVAPSAEAAAIRISNGVSTININDFGEPPPGPIVGTDTDPVLGSVFFTTNTLAGWQGVVLTAGSTKPALSTADAPRMLLTVTALSSGGAFNPATATLTVWFSDDSYGPSSNWAKATAEGVAANTVTYETFQDAGNARFAETSLITSQIFPAGPFGPPAVETTGFLPSGGGFPYSLTQKVTITHTAANQFSSGTFTLAVPDGGLALSLLGFALVGVEGLRRKFRKP